MVSLLLCVCVCIHAAAPRVLACCWLQSLIAPGAQQHAVPSCCQPPVRCVCVCLSASSRVLVCPYAAVGAPPSMHAQRSSCQPSALRLCVHACMRAPVLACSLLRSSSSPRTYLLGCAWRTSAFTRALDDFQGLSKACLPLHMTTTYDVLNV
jgi:hypothetical protein